MKQCEIAERMQALSMWWCCEIAERGEAKRQEVRMEYKGIGMGVDGQSADGSMKPHTLLLEQRYAGGVALAGCPVLGCTASAVSAPLVGTVPD
jgi:hypothetical protein